ncbi:MAG: M1 family metallopeptidase [Pseudomonadota bacterium]
MTEPAPVELEEEAALDQRVADARAAWAAKIDLTERDKFTYANYHEAVVRHVDFDLTADFDVKVLKGSVVLTVNYIDPEASRLILDTNQLTVDSVSAITNEGPVALDYKIGQQDPLLGSPMEIELPSQYEKIEISYRTSPEAEGLQWLNPEQTANGESPFLFSQFQPLYARTMAPLQDTPAVRITYSANIKTPPGLRALMSANQDRGPLDGDYRFEMPQPIPSYLIAIAVGDIDLIDIDDQIAVYAENYILSASADEFSDTPKMMEVSEAYYGPYLWDRYDMLVLPPSFPFGGMENPRLSFLTPTLVAGDKSLTNVVAHELAHSWSGNLVTNATWRDAWLNEGFTSYVENRIMEALYGVDRATMERSLDLKSLKRDIEEAERPALTAFKMPEDLAHPDDAFSQVSYAGGMFFLKFLEERFGRETFDTFVKRYFSDFAFQAITTEDFLPYFADNLWAKDPDAVTREEIEAWIYEPGLPLTVEDPQSDAFEKVSDQQAIWLSGGDANDIQTEAWTTHEWLHFINGLPDDLPLEQFEALDARFDLSNAQNAEIANVWYLKAIVANYEPAFAPLEQFLLSVGRGKFIYRLYQTLVKNDRRGWAKNIYDRARPGYHPIAQSRIDEIFN